MKTFDLSDCEIDVICHSLKLLEKDCLYDMVTFSRRGNLDAFQDTLNTLSSIQSILYKIQF